MAAAATEPPQPVAPLFVAEGDTVVFDINGDRQALIKVDARRCVQWPCRSAAAKRAALCCNNPCGAIQKQCNAC